jgi:hypothetical protein
MLLYDELTAGILAPSIASLISTSNDIAILELLYNKNIAIKSTLTSHDIRQYLMLYDLLLVIENGTSDACKIATRALDVFPVFDLSIPVILNKFSLILDGLIADTTLIPAFTITHKQDLIDMSIKYISRVDQLGITVTLTDIRKEIWNDDGTRKIV